jgi:hypothetical protein
LEHYLRQLVKYGGPKIDKKEAAFEMDVQLFVAYAYWVSTLTRAVFLVPLVLLKSSPQRIRIPVRLDFHSPKSTNRAQCRTCSLLSLATK